MSSSLSDKDRHRVNTKAKVSNKVKRRHQKAIAKAEQMQERMQPPPQPQMPRPRLNRLPLYIQVTLQQSRAISEQNRRLPEAHPMWPLATQKSTSKATE